MVNKLPIRSALEFQTWILVINCVILEKNSNNLGLFIWIYVYVLIQSYSLSEIGIDRYKNDRGHSVFCTLWLFSVVFRVVRFIVVLSL